VVSGDSWGSGEQERFELRGKIGAGGMGAVYRAFDQKRGLEVALKTVLKADGRSLFRFKREFRSLADVAHPNLVTLYDLSTTGDDWFFTMELVHGAPFSEYVRPFELRAPRVAGGAVAEGSIAGDDDEDDELHETRSTAVWQRPPTGRRRVVEGALDPVRLTEALAQLTDGVLALHRAGQIHRDLKPSNVLVEPSGRVAIMDFGLAFDSTTRDGDKTHDAIAVGTPMYMSPEQAADVPLTEASDWYSVGVMLYEALTGYRPFEEQRRTVLLVKQTEDPPPPTARCPDAPPALAQLCVALLHRDPRARPTGLDILATLGRTPSRATTRVRGAGVQQPFVGREQPLATLRRAYQDSRVRSVAVLVSATSGMGKTVLVRRFLAEIPASERALILRGRCYERESIPHKALDSVVDALTRELLGMSPAEIACVTPPDCSALIKLFDGG